MSFPDGSNHVSTVQQTVHKEQGLGTGIRQNPQCVTKECDVSPALINPRCINCGANTDIPKRGSASKHCRACRKVFRAVQRRAYSVVRYAVKTGKIPSAKSMLCVDCGARGEIFEHRDYARPLDIEPTCAACNQKRGSAPWSNRLPNTFKEKQLIIKRPASLSKREAEVVAYLIDGKFVTDIAKQMSLSPKTISTYRTRALAKGAIVEERILKIPQFAEPA